MQIQLIKNLSQLELDRVVDLHIQTIKESQLNKFGLTFLKIIYNELATSDNNLLFIIKENDDIIGLAGATKNVTKFYSDLRIKHFINLTLQVVKSTLSNPLLLIHVIIWFLLRRGGGKYPAELQFIGVNEKYQRIGLGTKLVKELCKQFQKDGISHYRVGTWASNKLSNAFYKKLNFKYLYSENILGEKFNFYLSPNP